MTGAKKERRKSPPHNSPASKKMNVVTEGSRPKNRAAMQPIDAVDPRPRRPRPYPRLPLPVRPDAGAVFVVRANDAIGYIRRCRGLRHTVTKLLRPTANIAAHCSSPCITTVESGDVTRRVVTLLIPGERQKGDYTHGGAGQIRDAFRSKRVAQRRSILGDTQN